MVMSELEVRRCKNCGQFFASGSYSGNDRYSILKSIEKDGKFITRYCEQGTKRYPHKSQILETFPFLEEKQVDSLNWEYTVGDYNQYQQCLNRLDSNGIVLTKVPEYKESFKCPVCGSESLYSKYDDTKYPRQYYSYYPSNGYFDVKNLNAYKYIEDEKLLHIAHETRIKDIKENITPEKLAVVDSDKVDIKRFLNSLLGILTAEYSLEQRLKELLHQQLSARQDVINAECKLGDDGEEVLKTQLESINNSINEIVNIDNFYIPEDWYISQHIKKPIAPEKPADFTLAEPKIPDYKKPGLFNKKAVLAENEELRLKYENEHGEWVKKKEEHDTLIRDYQEAFKSYYNDQKYFSEKENEYKTAEYNAWINELSQNNQTLKNLIEERKECEYFIGAPEKYRESQLKNNPAVILLDATKLEINNCIESLKKAYQAEKNYLSTNILFPKYGYFSAVATMTEYLMSGRCSELTGANGAYNLYENELRANRIIEQLDSINEKLDQIKSNQYMLYDAINRVNSQLSTLNKSAVAMTKELRSINSSLKDIKEASSVIAYNTAVSAYYSKINSELTDSIGLLIAMK